MSEKLVLNYLNVIEEHTAVRVEVAKNYEVAVESILISVEWILEEEDIRRLLFNYSRSLDWWFTSIFGFLYYDDIFLVHSPV